MINIILPLAGNATRLPISDIPKQMLDLGYERTPLGLAIQPIIKAYGFMNCRIGGIIPSGSEQRNKWGKYFTDNLTGGVLFQDEPNGPFGAVYDFLKHYHTACYCPTFVVYADTIADINSTIILNMSQKHKLWVGITPKRWVDGDVAYIHGTYVGGIGKQQEAIGFSPSGIFYFQDTIKLYGMLTRLRDAGFDDINTMDIINAYIAIGEYPEGCFIPKTIDCGTPYGLATARLLGKETDGKFYRT